MKTSSQIALVTFRVEVTFFTGDICYGSEAYDILAANWYQAEHEGLLRSVESPYDNERVPDRSRRVTAVAA